MRLFEFADAESQMELWKLITDSVWQAIYKQAQEQKQLDAQKAKSISAAPKQAKAFKSKIVSPQQSKANKTSAQEIQRQKVQSNAVDLIQVLEKLNLAVLGGELDAQIEIASESVRTRFKKN